MKKVPNTYYQLMDRHSNNVNIAWKGTHVTCLMVIIFLSITFAYCLNMTIKAFGSHCILGADLQFVPINKTNYNHAENYNKSITFHNQFTRWRSRGLCNRILGTFTATGVISTILMTFFMVVAKGGYNEKVIYTRSLEIVLPATVIAVILTVLITECYFVFNAGLRKFCAQFSPYTGTTMCTPALNEYTLVFHDDIFRVYIHMKIAEHTSMICLIFLVLLLSSLILRLLRGPDFTVLVYRLTYINPEGSQASLDWNQFGDKDSLSQLDFHLESNERLLKISRSRRFTASQVQAIS